MPHRPRRRSDWVTADLEEVFGAEDDEDEDSWVDEESRLRPPALPTNLEAALAKLPGKQSTILEKSHAFMIFFLAVASLFLYTGSDTFPGNTFKNIHCSC